MNPGKEFSLCNAQGVDSGLRCRAWSLSTHYSAYVTADRQRQLTSGEASLGFFVNSISGARLAYMPAVPQVDDALLAELGACDVLLFDGTFWSNDELIRVQGSGQTAQQMGHVAVEETLVKLAGVRRPRKIFLHINNTNPMLDEASPRISPGAGRGLGNCGGWMAVQPVETETASQSAHLLSLEELRAALQATGEERYHHKHPFHLLMHEGKLSRGQLQAWALNRYYYQSIIPIKDSIILSRGPDPVFRRAWRKRVVDHDGDATSEGGIKRWVKLAEATGLDPAQVRAGQRHSSGYSLRGQRILEHRSQPDIAGSGRLLADRIVFSEADHFARGKITPTLSLAGGRSGLFRGSDFIRRRRIRNLP